MKRLFISLGLALGFGLAAAGCASHNTAPLPRDVAQYSRVPSADYGRAPVAGLDGAARQRLAEGDFPGAQQDFDSALQINPFDPIALNNLAVAKSENGQFHEAVAMLERASRLAPDNADIAANLSRLRAYANSYALEESQAPLETADADDAAAQTGLPPPPPPLWASLVPVSALPAANAGYYYEGCANGTAKDSGKAKGRRRKGERATEICR